MVVILATNNDDITSCLQIRHEVYCKEFNFEAINSLEIETDEFDKYSHHLLLFEDLKPIGTVRLIFGSLPSQRYLNYQILDMDINWIDTYEISRLAILKQYRTRSNSKLLYQSAYSLARDLNKSIVIIANQYLARYLKMLGYSVTQLTSYFELNGARAVFIYLIE